MAPEGARPPIATRARELTLLLVAPVALVITVFLVSTYIAPARGVLDNSDFFSTAAGIIPFVYLAVVLEQRVQLFESGPWVVGVITVVVLSGEVAALWAVGADQASVLAFSIVAVSLIYVALLILLIPVAALRGTSDEDPAAPE
jgi:hypothetical protein